MERGELSKNSVSIDQILNSTYDGIVAVDKNGDIILFNDSAKKIFKLEDKDYTGYNIADVTPNAKMPLILKTKSGDINAAVDIDSEFSVITSRCPILDDDGNVIGAVAVFKDIPQLKRLSTEVSRLEEMNCIMNTIFYESRDGVCIVGMDGKFSAMNKSYENLLGCSMEEVMECDSHPSFECGLKLHNKVVKSKCDVCNARLKIGRYNRDAIVNASPIIIGGEQVGTVISAKDQTEIKALINKIENIEQHLRQVTGKYTFDDIIGQNKEFLKLVQKAKIAAETSATILLTGESGTGKELFAHAIHNAGPRRNHPFIRINCAAINESLVESELFGYDEGAFTGATKNGKAGYFEMANGGTVFLDEISQMSMSIQSKLLRILQEKEVMRVGSSKVINVDIRVIAASNTDLREEVKAGRFREDLYYRLNIIQLEMIPLRERKDDIIIIANEIIKQFNSEYTRQVDGISEDCFQTLEKKYWRGNVRELKNYLNRTIIYMDKNKSIIEKKIFRSFQMSIKKVLVKKAK